MISSAYLMWLLLFSQPQPCSPRGWLHHNKAQMQFTPSPHGVGIHNGGLSANYFILVCATCSLHPLCKLEYLRAVGNLVIRVNAGKIIIALFYDDRLRLWGDRRHWLVGRVMRRNVAEREHPGAKWWRYGNGRRLWLNLGRIGFLPCSNAPCIKGGWVQLRDTPMSPSVAAILPWVDIL